jgi:DNA mismatch endonuclease (patch repair protein)
MAAVRSADTGPELYVRHALHRAGFRYRLSVRELPGRPDIVLPRYETVVLVHGCFWHGHNCKKAALPSTRRDFWREKIQANQLRDVTAVEQLKDLGWSVYVIWECSLRAETEKLIIQLNKIRKTNQ